MDSLLHWIFWLYRWFDGKFFHGNRFYGILMSFDSKCHCYALIPCLYGSLYMTINHSCLLVNSPNSCNDFFFFLILGLAVLNLLKVIQLISQSVNHIICLLTWCSPIICCCRFDLFFRKNPFGGEYTVFGGLEECIRLIANFKLKDEEISYLRSVMPTCEVWILTF